MGKSTISMAIFNSYDSLPEGNSYTNSRSQLIRITNFSIAGIASIAAWCTDDGKSSHEILNLQEHPKKCGFIMVSGCIRHLSKSDETS